MANTPEQPTTISTEQFLNLQKTNGTVMHALAPEEMSVGLVELSSEPDGDQNHDAERPILEIIDDRTIAIEGIHLALTWPKIFVLNALRINQGQYLEVDDVMAMGFPGVQKTVSKSVVEFFTKLNRNPDSLFIEHKRIRGKKGNPSVFTLLPQVKVVDRRPELFEMIDTFLKRDCAVRDENGAPKILETGSIAFTSTQKRAAVTSLMFASYRDRARTDDYFASQFLDVARKQGMNDTTNFKPHSPLPREEADILLGKKEAALMVYLSGKEHLTQQEEEVIIEGVRAGVELLGRNLDLVRALAAVYSEAGSNKPLSSYHDLYQEGVMQLWETIFRQPFNKSGEHSFRFIAANRIRRYSGRGILALRQNGESPVSLPRDYWDDYRGIMDYADEYMQEHGGIASGTMISDATSLPLDKVHAIRNAAKRGVSLDAVILDEGETALPQAWLEQEDFVDNELDRMEMEDAIDALFTSSQLTDTEKIVLSLHYQVFHASLCGAEISSSGSVTFTYPHSRDAFNAIADHGPNLKKISRTVGRMPHFARYAHDKALAKARHVLQESDTIPSDFDPAIIEAREEQQRKAVISLAQEISPHERISKEMLLAFNKAGTLLFTPRYIERLFGSMTDFQLACGFKPHKARLSRTMTQEDIVNLALEIRGDATLGTNEVKVLSRHGEFVGYAAIQSRFGSMSAFHAACKREIFARRSSD
ncbi:MAG: hypothetical protein ABWX94_03180 [Candidatus Saccharimonadales bacterium]